MPITTILLSSDDLVPVNIAGAAVEFYNTAGVFQTSGTTDTNGSTTVTLPAADYDVLIFKVGVSVLPHQPQRITVLTQTPPNVFSITGHVRTMPESTNPNLCRVSGYLIDIQGRAKPNVKITVGPLFELIDIASQLVDPDGMITVVSDSNGYVEFDLIRGINYEAFFIEKVEWKQVAPGRLYILAPDLPAVRLDFLLFPIPVNVAFSVDTLSVPSGTIDSTIVLTVAYSDGNPRQLPLPWGTYQLILSSPDIFDYTVAGSALVITGKSPGTATLTAIRDPIVTSYWNPAPPFVADILTVTVT